MAAAAFSSRSRGRVADADRLERPLDGLNFFLADVRDGLGSHLALWLLAIRHWDEAAIGVVLSLGGIAGILAQIPAGTLVDATRRKRGLLAAAALFVTGGSLLLPLLRGFWPVALIQAACSAAAAVLAQRVMVPMAMLAGRKADFWGRKPFSWR
ncbi:hypothetical protein [Benzoatithermus flavus]|uniref:MFS transporter n=1 Tax=Benzoatithermus flavus TaxID=3108223 RepID=A0ABU8XRG7_9PROT